MGGALPPGWTATYLESVPSTQDVAREAAAAGSPGRTIFVANLQTAGRGRQGRSWIAPAGAALMLSTLFRERGTELFPHRYTMAVSVALAQAIEQLAPGLKPEVKWPNDVMLGGRKVAGVLAESTWNEQDLAVIVGVGINVNTSAADLAEAAPTATSIAAESGRELEAVGEDSARAGEGVVALRREPKKAARTGH